MPSHTAGLATPTPAQAHAAASIRRASQATGVDFSYLMATAQRESSLNPTARARTSSAGGLFQFVDQTWLATLKTAGGRHGYGGYAAQIAQGRDGRYYVADAQARAQIMSLKYNPDANALMGAEFAAGNAAYLSGRIGRAPSQGELYAAHFLGPAGAAQLITAAESRPSSSAAALFPAAARANPTIFYSQGRPLSVSEVHGRLTSVGGGAPVEVPEATDSGFVRSPALQARYDRLRAEQEIMRMAFGDGGLAGSLLSGDLLSAFGPSDERKTGAEADQANLLSRAMSGYGRI